VIYDVMLQFLPRRILSESLKMLLPVSHPGLVLKSERLLLVSQLLQEAHSKLVIVSESFWLSEP
jgi:hypothetical protein